MNSKYQVSVSMPDLLGHVDDSLAMNSMVGFISYKGQGYVKLTVSEPVESFVLFVNNRRVDFGLRGPGEYTVDISEYTVNGMNSLMISAVEPAGLMQKINVDIPYPVVLGDDIEAGNKELLREAGISEEAVRVIEAIAEKDIEHGFTSAQMALIKDGRMVYRNAWGRLNSYEQDGRPKTDSPFVSCDTLYDLASNTKMYSVNYAIQYLVSAGLMDIEKNITSFLGDGFAEDVIDLKYEGCDSPSREVQIQWKKSLTVKDVLRHQAGFPADPRFFFEHFDQSRQKHSDIDNILFTGNDGSPETRERTLKALCKTPLMYEPGSKTVYSDADYMLLGFIIEQTVGKDLNTFLKETFWQPMGLDHITFNPLDNGFHAENCAATELNGNSRDGAAGHESTRSETLQGKVHDEKAWCCMGGISGHAGLFANATDLAKLASVMLTGGYGENRFFSKGVVDLFSTPQRETTGNWGLGWNRQGDMERSWYFSPLSSRNTIGHQGWTGTLTMIDPEKNLVMAFLTNKINSPVTNTVLNPDRFDGNWFTTSSLGHAAQLIYLSFCGNDPHDAICGLLKDMAAEKHKLVLAAGDAAKDVQHPIRRAEAALNEVAEMWNE